MKAKNVVSLTEDNLIPDYDSHEGWELKKLKDITKKVPTIKPEFEPERIFGYVDISSINNETNKIFEFKKIRGADAPSRARQSIQSNDVLFSNVRTYLRNIAIVPDDLDVQVCSTGFTVLRSNGAIVPKFLFYYTLTNHFINEVTPQQTGSQYPATTDRVVKDASIRLPSIPEQHRVVARVEALLSQVNAARDRLNKVPLIMKRFRQAVLAAACSGRLTEGWRGENPNIENIADFIKKLKKEKLTIDKKRMRYLSDLDFSECHEIPETWGWVKLGEISIAIDVDHKMPKAMEKGIPLISPKDFVEPDKIDFKDAKKISHDDYERMSRKITPESGDILLSRYGTIGKVRKVPADLKFQISYSLCLIRPFLDLRRNDYLYWILQSSPVYHQALANDKSSSIPDLGIKDINNFTIPLPPLEEQYEIVRCVDALIALADQIEQQVADATKRTEALTQAVLAKAFRGELVATAAELTKKELL